MFRMALVVLTAGLLMIVVTGLSTATAQGATKGAWKRAMVAANKELAKTDQDIRVHPRLNYRNTWGFAARATAERLHKAFGIRVTARLSTGLKRKLRPFLPKAASSTAKDRKWAIKWKRQAAKNLRHAKKHARCLRTSVPKSLRRTIRRDADESWRQYGREAKKRAYALAKYVRRTMKKMRDPGGSGVRRWLPLARHEGWPRASEAMLVKVIYRESKGNPSLRAGPYRGLLQIDAGHARSRNLYNPRTNLAVGLQLYKRLGWRPWAATAY